MGRGEDGEGGGSSRGYEAGFHLYAVDGADTYTVMVLYITMGEIGEWLPRARSHSSRTDDIYDILALHVSFWREFYLYDRRDSREEFEVKL